MPVNKVEYFGETLIDISDSTITPEKVLKGEIEYDKAGNKIDGNIETYSGEEAVIVEDGRTRLYITIPENNMPNRPPLLNQVPLYFNQSVSNGVNIDWGDDTNPETLPETGNVNATHTYVKGGEYIISLEPLGDCELSLEQKDGFCVLGAVSKDTSNNAVYPKMLNKAIIGKSVLKVGDYAFRYCKNLSSVVVLDGVREIGKSTFSGCFSLSSVVLPDSIDFFGSFAFSDCSFVTSFVVPEKVKSLAGEEVFSGSTFSDCKSLKEIHFLPVNPPIIKGGYLDEFKGIPDDCIFYVPKESVDVYKNDTNWTVYANRIQEEPA